MKTLILLVFIIMSLMLKAQTNYNSGNEAYVSESNLGFNPVKIGNGSMVYIYDTAYKIYKSGSFILIPDLTNTGDGRYIDTAVFFGYSGGGMISDTAYNWDKKTLNFNQNDFDVKNMFVSPVSDINMNYAKALQFSSTFCNYNDCYAIIDEPSGGLAYTGYLPSCDTFNIWAGEELIDAGDLKNTGISQKVSQQQLLSTPNRSYCVNRYGQGWRLPTDMEVGHINDNEGVNVGLDSTYMGLSPFYIWTSSLFKTYTVKRWATRITDGYWENCGGFLYVPNFVRCVFPGYDNNIITTVKDNTTSGFSLYPNPACNIVYIENNDHAVFSEASLCIYDAIGRIMLQEALSSEKHKLDISNLKQGLYILHVSDKEKTYVFRFLKI